MIKTSFNGHLLKGLAGLLVALLFSMGAMLISHNGKISCLETSLKYIGEDVKDIKDFLIRED